MMNLSFRPRNSHNSPELIAFVKNRLEILSHEHPEFAEILTILHLNGVYLSGSFLLFLIEQYIGCNAFGWFPNDIDLFVDDKTSLAKLHSILRRSGLFSLDMSNIFKRWYHEGCNGIEFTVDTYTMKGSSFFLKKFQIIICKDAQDAIQNFDLPIVRNSFWLTNGHPHMSVENYSSIVHKRIEVDEFFSFGKLKYREWLRLKKYISRGYHLVKFEYLNHKWLS